MGRLIRVAVALLVLHAVWRVGSAYWVYYQLDDEIRQIALFAGPQPPSDVKMRVLAAANRYHVPLAPDRVAVRREGSRTYIEASYDEPLEVLPTIKYPWTFKLSAEGWAGALYERR